jgi:AcrR family transcriptional regulator
VVRVPAERLLTAVRELAGSDAPPAERLRGIVSCHVDVLVNIYDFAAVYLYEVAGRELGPEWRALDREYTSLVERVIAEGIAAGEFSRRRDPHLMTMTLLGALNWLTRWWNPEGELNPETVAREVSDIVLGGFVA